MRISDWSSDVCSSDLVSAVLSEQPQAEILLDVPAEEYHRKVLGTVSAGVLRRLNEQTPAHYRAWVDEAEDDDTPAKVFGRAYHDRLLLPDLFAPRYVGQPVGAPMRPTAAWRGRKRVVEGKGVAIRVNNEGR